MKLAVIGSGYVGLVTGAGFSNFGNHVTCVDIDPSRIERLRRGEIPFHEPGLSELVQRNARAGRLVFTTDTAEAVREAEIVFLAVGTPSRPDGAADLSYLLEAARQVGLGLAGGAGEGTIIVTKSTVPVGTGDLVRETIAKVTTQPFSVASNPEFLKEGDAVNDFMKPARVIIGTDDPQALDVLRRLYTGFLRTSDRIQVMDLRSAELTKYAANAMLATRISFMNELAALADKLGADIEKVRKGIGSDPRIGAKFLFPGVGFGGSCFPKDLRALRDMGRANDVRLGIVESVVDANDRSKRAFAARVVERFGGSLAGKRIAIAGLGGVGGAHLLTLTRLGIGAFHIADFDVFEIANFNRQAGASVATLGKAKADVLAAMARDVNPGLKLTVFGEGVTAASVDKFLDGVDLYVDGLDFFAFEARKLVFAKCAERLIPAITAAPLGMGAALLNFLPGRMTFEQYFRWEGCTEDEMAAPDASAVDFKGRKAPSMPMACELCAGIAATEALKILLKRRGVKAAPTGVHFDAYRNRLATTQRPGGNRHPLQRVAIAIARRQLGIGARRR